MRVIFSAVCHFAFRWISATSSIKCVFLYIFARIAVCRYAESRTRWHAGCCWMLQCNLQNGNFPRSRSDKEEPTKRRKIGVPSAATICWRSSDWLLTIIYPLTMRTLRSILCRPIRCVECRSNGIACRQRHMAILRTWTRTQDFDFHLLFRQDTCTMCSTHKAGDSIRLKAN